MFTYRFFSSMYQLAIKSVSVLKFKISLFYFLVLFLLVVSVKASTNTYYVGNDGSDSYNSTQAQVYGTPWATIQKAADNVNAGDTVIVKDGTYTDNNGDGFIVKITQGGSSGNLVTFKSENKWGAVLDGQSYSGGYGFASFGETASYVRIEDFEIKYLRHSGIFTNWVNVKGNNPNYQEYVGNKVHNIRTFGIGNINGDGCLIDSNLIYDVAMNDTASPGHGIYVVGPDATVTNNIVYGVHIGTGGTSYCLQIKGTAHNLVLANNTFIGPVDSNYGVIMIYLDGSNMTIENNIFYDGSGGYGIRVYAHDAGAVTVRNNLSNGGTLMSYHSNSDSSLFTLSNNITYTDSNNTTNTDPLFKDEVNKDYTITAGSPAIDQGFATDITDHDYAGNPRPVDGNGDGVNVPDIGAYEWFGVSGISEPQGFSLVGIGN